MLRNTLFSALSLLVKATTTLGLTFLIGIIFGDTAFAEFSLSLAIGALIIVICEYGSPLWLPKVDERGVWRYSSNENRYNSLAQTGLSEAFNLRIYWAGIISLIIFSFYYCGILKLTELLILLSCLLYSFQTAVYFHYRKLGEFGKELTWAISSEGLLIIFVFIGLFVECDFLTLVTLVFCSRLLSAIVVCWYVLPKVKLSYQAALHSIKIRFSFFSNLIISFSILYIDTFLVFILQPGLLVSHQGFFRLVFLFTLLVPLLNSSAYYFLSNLFSKDTSSFYRLLRKLYLLIFLVSPASFILLTQLYDISGKFLLRDSFDAIQTYSFAFAFLVLFKHLSALVGLILTIIGFQSLRSLVLFSHLVLSSIVLIFGLKYSEADILFLLIASLGGILFALYSAALFRVRQVSEG